MVLGQAKRNINVKRSLKRTLKPIGKLKIFCFHAKNSVLFNFCQKSGGGRKLQGQIIYFFYLVDQDIYCFIRFDCRN